MGSKHMFWGSEHIRHLSNVVLQNHHKRENYNMYLREISTTNTNAHADNVFTHDPTIPCYCN